MQTHEQLAKRMMQRLRLTRTVGLMLAMLVCVGVAGAADTPIPTPPRTIFDITALLSQFKLSGDLLQYAARPAPGPAPC